MASEPILMQLNPHACRTYLLGQKNVPDVVLIDPVLDHLSDYLTLLEKNRFRLTMVVDTHTHADHLSAGPALKDQTGCDYAMHKRGMAACANYRFDDGFQWHIGDVPVTVLHTPGHTKDSMVLVLPDVVLTGDTLFLDDGGAGRDDLPGGDPGEHWDSLQRLLTLPGRLIVHPGHEYRHRAPSPLERQRTTNPHLVPRGRPQFIDYVQDLKLGAADWMADVLKANYACARDPKAAWIPVDVPACEVKGTLDLGAAAQAVASISPRELARRLSSAEAPALLDVRDRTELVDSFGHLPGVRHVPIQQLARRLDELDAFKDKDLVVVCRSGGRAFTGAQILAQAGFRRVLVLKDGMVGWNQAGLPVERTL